MKILIIEDDIDLASYIKKELEYKKHKVTISTSVSGAIKNKLAINNNVLILDLILNDEKGEDYVKYLKKNNISIPTLVLSSLSSTTNKIDLLNAGVDDYMTKPFEISELNARLEAIYRRSIQPTSKPLEKYKDITFSWKENKIIYKKKEIFLTKKECKLLKLLFSNRGDVVKSEEILKYVWNIGPGYHSNILQSLVRHLRKTLLATFKTDMVKNIHGIGYTLQLPEEK